MASLKLAAIIVAIVAFIAGIRAAYLWYRASRVQIVPMWVKDGRIEPVNPGQAQAEWTVATNEAVSKSGELNRGAAKWTAAAVALSTISTLLGAL